MMATNLTDQAGGSGGFFRWWLDELAGVLPYRMRRKRPPRQSLLLRRAGDAIEVFRRRGRALSRLGALTLPPPLPARLGEPLPTILPPESRRLVQMLGRRPAPVVLVLESDEGLLCPDLLPAGAEGDLDRIMPHRVDLLTPWPADRVHSGYRVLGRRKDGQVEVLLAAAPRAAIDATVARLAAYGVNLDGVDLLRDDGDPAEINLLARPKPRRGFRWWWVAAIILVAAALAGGALAGYEIYRLHGQLQTRQALAAALEQRLADLPALRARVEALRRQAGFIPEQQRQTPSPSVVLEALSRILPDSIWLDSVSVADGELTLSGYAEDAAQVLPIIESSGHFSDAQFRAPSTRVEVPGTGGGTREVERFAISAKVKPLAEPEP